jgi:hypothetical protein
MRNAAAERYIGCRKNRLLGEGQVECSVATADLAEKYAFRCLTEAWYLYLAVGLQDRVACELNDGGDETCYFLYIS